MEKTKALTDSLFLIRSEGIGDTIAATPAIRYFAKEFGIKVDVWTRHPEIFERNPHVARVHSGFEPDVEWLQQWPRPNIKVPFMTNANAESARVRHYHSHLVDYCSANALQLTLQAKDKWYEMPVSAAALDDAFKALRDGNPAVKQWVVIHPTDTWKTRRMPPELWAETVQLVLKHAPTSGIVIIGKNVEDRMPLDLKRALDAAGLGKSKRVLNLVNRLSLAESVATIEAAGHIVTTDSGALCMAGCTDARIYGVFTVNPPEFRAPFRRLPICSDDVPCDWQYKLTVCNDLPSCIHCGIKPSRLDKNFNNCLNYKTPMCCLPSADLLAEQVIHNLGDTKARKR